MATKRSSTHQSAEVMLVGEQPGDQEDCAGHPFVGPAGKLLDSSLREAGIDRSRVYVTNSVKHFKFWLQEEIQLVKPRPQLSAR